MKCAFGSKEVVLEAEDTAVKEMMGSLTILQAGTRVLLVPTHRKSIMTNCKQKCKLMGFHPHKKVLEYCEALIIQQSKT